MNEMKISVIIPVFNVSVYLAECLEAVLKQTYANTEILLIDDGSTDGSEKICDEYAEKDLRVRVIHQKNAGAASARNAGLELAVGDYIAFVDSDDVPHPDYLEKMLIHAEDTGADICVCGYRKWFVSGCEVCENRIDGLLSAQDYLAYYIQDWTSGLIWNKLFKSYTIKGVLFEEGHVIDDEFFTYQAVLGAKSVVLCRDVLYDYRQRRTGVMTQGKKKRMLQDRMAYYPERFERVTSAYPVLYTGYLSNLADTLIRFKREAAPYHDLWNSARKLQHRYLQRVLTGRIGVKEKYAYIRALFEKRSIIQDEEPVELESYFD